MVRRNELACRDEWSQSLWQPREGQPSNGDLPFQRPTVGPLPPALAENLRSMLNLDAAVAASTEGEDVLLSEARIVFEPQESSEPPPRPFPAGNFDPRTAIFRARETYRERIRAKAAAERQSAGAEAGIGSPPEEDVATRSLESVDDNGTDRRPQEVRPATEELSAEASEAGALRHDPGEPVWQEIEPPLPAVTGQYSTPVPGRSIAVPREHQVAEPETAWQPISDQDDAIGMQTARTRSIEEADSGMHRPQLEEREALPDWYRADLPRICRTCRDYRPSADGQRGWCANSWAFTHRRLVLEEDPAPCQSAIGDWWLPVDDVWLVAADVASHGRPTPLLDRLTANSEQQRRRS